MLTLTRRRLPAARLRRLLCASASGGPDDTGFVGHAGEHDPIHDDEHAHKVWHEETKPHFSRVILTPSFRQIKHETMTVFETFRDALERREVYRCPQIHHPNSLAQGSQQSIPALAADAKHYRIVSRKGVLFAEGDPFLEELNADIPSVEAYYTDIMWLWGVCMSSPARQVADRRLNILDLNFKFHNLSNGYLEYDATSQSRTDFWRVAKVDNHCHAASLMTATHLLEFMRTKGQKCYDEIVHMRGQREHVTLGQLFKEKDVDFRTLSVSQLAVRMRQHMFFRFDYFNRAIAPKSDHELRTVFLKCRNHIGGKYFAELLQEVSQRAAAGISHVAMEPRVSIYGQDKREWSQLASWWKQHGFASRTNMRFMIQFPRLFALFQQSGAVKTFEEFLHNCFQPLFEVTRDPSIDPALHELLCNCGGVDSVDDESQWDVLHFDPQQYPADVASNIQPVYSYYMYYYWANLASLNRFRAVRGLNTIPFRPHCGESGAAHHLATTFLTADGIAHGINLRRNLPIQYLYYLAQIPIAMSPLSNNALFLKLPHHPFKEFFGKGLRVSLTTDDPLVFHNTHEPLMEEYSVAQHLFGLSDTDLSEIALNSVKMSSFSDAIKAQWLGKNHNKPGVEGNDIHKSNVSNVRILYREECLRRELNLLALATKKPFEQPTSPFPIPLPVADGTWRCDLESLQYLADRILR